MLTAMFFRSNGIVVTLSESCDCLCGHDNSGSGRIAALGKSLRRTKRGLPVEGCLREGRLLVRIKSQRAQSMNTSLSAI